MRYGIHAGLWMAEWSDDPGPILDRAAALGYDGVELSLLGVTPGRAAALKRRAADAGLRLTCSTGLGADADPTAEDPALRARGRAALEAAIRTTAALGAERLAGVVHAPWGVFAPGRQAERRARSAEVLGALDGVLAETGVVLGIEAINRFETDLANTAAEACALAAACGSPRVGVLLDSFHLNIEEKDAAGAIRASAGHLVHFHVSDNDRGVPGRGQIDFAAQAAALDAIGYDGWITAEMFVVPGLKTSADLNIWRAIEPGPDEAARAALAFLRETFG
jgi:D-psicose/D-tagatose/L-ribulose 3-epimerase